jgi:hypothetical protein
VLEFPTWPFRFSATDGRRVAEGLAVACPGIANLVLVPRIVSGSTIGPVVTRLRVMIPRCRAQFPVSYPVIPAIKPESGVAGQLVHESEREPLHRTGRVSDYSAPTVVNKRIVGVHLFAVCQGKV